MADTAAERLAKAMYPWGGDALMIKPAQRAIVGSSLGVVPQPYACVAHDALGTPPPPDPHEDIARPLHVAVCVEMCEDGQSARRIPDDLVARQVAEALKGEVVTAAELRAMSAEATPAPWSAYKYGVTATDRDGTLCEPCGDYQDDMRWEDKELIVWLRNHADALADLIDAARQVGIADQNASAMAARLGARDHLAQVLAALETDQ